MTPGQRARWLHAHAWRAIVSALAIGLGACSVDTSDINFVPDAQLDPPAAFSGAPGSGGANVPPPIGSGAGGTSAGSGNDDACQDKEGAARCTSNGELELCKAGEYSVVERCEHPDLCNALRKTCLDCAPGTFRCTKDTLEQCNLEGSAYELVKTCEEGQCEADAHTGYCKVCEPREIVCEASERDFEPAAPDSEEHRRPSASLRRCKDDGSGTELVDTCNFSRPVCDAEEESCLVCKKGAVLCDGSVLARCSDNGMKLEEIADCGNPALCDAQRGRCIATDCSRLRDAGDPAALVECRGTDGTELSYCGPNGDWDVLALCDNRRACEAGTGAILCRGADEDFCVPGETSCEGNVLRGCADFVEPGKNGPSWHDYATCAYGCAASGSAECATQADAAPYAEGLVCTPGEPAFVDCSDGSCDEVSCDDGTICAGTQLGCSACVPNTLRCEDNVLVRCEEDGSGESAVEDCGDGYCDRFRGECLPARPGEPFCSGKELIRIDTDGMVQKLEVCASEQLCSPQAGCLSPMCVVGSKVCDEEEGRQVLNCVDGIDLVETATRCASSDRCEDGLGCVTAFRVAAGEAHTCVVLREENGDADALGLVKCWGANESGQLGNGASVLGDEAEARPVVFRDGSTFTASARFLNSGLCAGKNFTCADAMLAPAPGQVKQEPGVVCWGANDQGQLGIGTTAGTSSEPPINAVTLPVTRGLDLAPRDGTLDAFTGLGQVTCGADFACALDGEGAAWCWGANEAGQLGIGQATMASWPAAQKIDLAKMANTPPVFKSIAAGAQHVCAVDASDEVWCWGEMRGSGGSAVSAAEAPVHLGFEVSNYALGRDFTILERLDTSDVRAFGQNFFGQLGTGTNVSTEVPTAAGMLDADAISALFSGPMAAHACAFLSGSLACWGANSLGQLGDGTTEDRYMPVVALDAKSVDVFEGAGSGSVALGKSHTCAVDGSGGLWCWGGNERKQLGSSVKRAFTATPTEALTE